MARTRKYFMFWWIYFSFLFFQSICSALFIHKDDSVTNEPLQIRNVESVRAVLQRVRRSSDAKTRSENDSCQNPSEKKQKSLDSKFVDLKDSKTHNQALVQWVKNDVVIVLTINEQFTTGHVSESTLWRSTDYGDSFQAKAFPPNATVKYFVAKGSKIVFADVGHKYIYTSADAGATLFPQSVPFAPDSIKFHPTKSDWLMSYSTFEQSLHLSTDFGKTWIKIHDNVGPRFYWYVPNVDQDLKTIHLQVLDIKTGKFRYKACIASPTCTDITMEDYVGDEDVMSLHVDGKYIFVEKTVHEKTKLYVSYNRQAFKEAMFGTDVKPQAYSLLAVSEEQVFIAVLERWNDGSVYMSDKTGQYFTYSLANVQSLYYNLGAEIDFYKVKSMKGVFIANHRLDSGYFTVISFDNGGNWNRIPAPKVDYDGKAIDCNNDCFLNLHLDHSTYAYRIPRIISEKEAPGIILANGMIGPNLSLKNVSSKSHLFLSTDGGLTWSMQLKGCHFTKIVDQGGALIAINENPDAIVTRCTIMYTCNEGKTWENHTFSKKPVIVDGILTEPGLTSLIATVYGHEGDFADWRLIKLNFTSLLSRKCAETDYVPWSPNLKLGDQCILGVNYTYVHRRPNAQCFNGPDYKNEITSERCDCTERDFECDFGYKPVGNQCRLETWFHPDKPQISCPENSEFEKTNKLGKRKVVADRCIPNSLAEKYKPTNLTCPILKPGEITIITKKSDQLIFATNEIVQLFITQFVGSKASTTYTWDFGDGTPPLHRTGFQEGSTVNHSYVKGGDFKVRMDAKGSNNVGTTTVYFDINVFDAIRELDADVPPGVVVNQVFQLNCTAIPADAKHGHVFYAWTFGDENKKRPLLTYDTSIKHVYKKPGNYVVTLEAFNAVSRFYRKFTVHVYSNSDRFLIVRLGFDKYLDKMKIDTEEWRLFLGNLLRNKLIATLTIPKDVRLGVVVNTGIPTTADVEIYTNKADSEIDKTITSQIRELGEEIVTKVNRSHVMIDLINGYVIQIRNARIYGTGASPTPVKPSKGTSGLTAIYICVPILIAAIFVSALVFLHYRRRFRHVHRYAMMRNRPQTDNLLNDIDDDDDDPPLDPNPNIFNSDMDDDPLAIVGEPTLVMMTGAEIVNDGEGNQVNV